MLVRGERLVHIVCPQIILSAEPRLRTITYLPAQRRANHMVSRPHGSTAHLVDDDAVKQHKVLEIPAAQLVRAEALLERHGDGHMDLGIGRGEVDAKVRPPTAEVDLKGTGVSELQSRLERTIAGLEEICAGEAGRCASIAGRLELIALRSVS